MYFEQVPVRRFEQQALQRAFPRLPFIERIEIRERGIFVQRVGPAVTLVATEQLLLGAGGVQIVIDRGRLFGLRGAKPDILLGTVENDSSGQSFVQTVRDEVDGFLVAIRIDGHVLVEHGRAVRAVGGGRTIVHRSRTIVLVYVSRVG